MEPLNPSNNSSLLINEKTPRIIFKIKKYYIIYIQNGKSMDFDISETAAKNILVYRIFSKEDWEQKAKKCGYRYLNQVSENWKDEIQSEQLITQEKKDLEYI